MRHLGGSQCIPRNLSHVPSTLGELHVLALSAIAAGDRLFTLAAHVGLLTRGRRALFFQRRQSGGGAVPVLPLMVAFGLALPASDPGAGNHRSWQSVWPKFHRLLVSQYSSTPNGKVPPDTT